jgi:hypothetical protein
MARKKDLCQASDGHFVRNIGWKRTETGYAQPKFYLGRDESTARVISLRLEQLWEQVARRWKRELDRSPAFPEYQIHTDSMQFFAGGQWKSGSYLSLTSIGFRKPANEDASNDRPVWDQLTREIAEAVRRGESIVKVSCQNSQFDKVSGGDFMRMSDWLTTLQEDITVVRIELLDVEAQRQFDENQQREARQHIEHGRKLMHRKAGGETLRVALDKYTEWIDTKFVTAEKRLSGWGANQKRLIGFIRRNLANCTLGEMGSERIEEQIDVLRLRPLSQEGKQISVAWAKSCIKQYRNFLRWLNRSEEFSWKRPPDLEIGQIRIPLTPQEKSATVRSTQVKTYTLEELQTCWEYGSPFQRLLMLLGLNCGFGRAEIASLEMDDLLLHQMHPHEDEVGCQSTVDDGWILRNRHKTGVYGEWKLWPETIQALKWWLKQRESIAVSPGVTTVLVTQKGQRYDTPTKGNHANYQLPNRWYALTDRIQKDKPAFRKLSFKILRKTAGNLIRKAADGEVAGVFLCHGKPVKSDELLDLYTNRDFAKVFNTIDAVGQNLQPCWAGVPVPFPETRKKGGANISLSKIRRIQKMKRQGFKTNVIAELLKVSRVTVWRWASLDKEGEPGAINN